MATPEAPTPGPCIPWITADDVAAACDALDGSDPSVYDAAALSASETLFQLSGRQFTGECGPVTVRPCDPTARCGPSPCGCCWTSRVKLAGVVRQIAEVKIDGTALDAGEYRVDQRRWLVRLADADGRRQRWPACQRLDLADTEDRTFAVTYTYGVDPPQAGLDAAAELACNLAAAAGGGECDLPAGTVRVTRQGITIDLERFLEKGVTGLRLVDVFLQAFNPAGRRSPSTVWSPDVQPYPRRVGG